MQIQRTRDQVVPLRKVVLRGRNTGSRSVGLEYSVRTRDTAGEGGKNQTSKDLTQSLRTV